MVPFAPLRRCRDVGIPECASGPGLAQGACLAEELAAAESSNPRFVVERFNDPRYASGAAHLRNACQKDHCQSECRGL
jgi:hypothetical protein